MGPNPSCSITLGISLHQRNGGHTVSFGNSNFLSNSRPRPAQGHASPSLSPRPAGPRPPPPVFPPQPLPAGRRRRRQQGGRTHVRQRPPAGPPGAARGLRRGERRKARSAPPGSGAPPPPPALPALRRLPAPGPRASFGTAATRSSSGGRASSGRGRRRCAARRIVGHVPAILWSPPPPRSPGDPGLHGAARAGEPVDARGRGGEEEGRAGGGARAQGGPRARDWAAGGAARGRRGQADAAGPRPRPALPGRSVRLRDRRRSLLPPPSLRAQRRALTPSAGGASRRAQRTKARKVPPARDPAACARNRGRAGPPSCPARFVGSPALPTASSAVALPRWRAVRRPAPPSQGCTYVRGDPRPGGGRGSHPPGGGSAASPRAGGLCEVTGNKAQGQAAWLWSDKVILVLPAFAPGTFDLDTVYHSHVR